MYYFTWNNVFMEWNNADCLKPLMRWLFPNLSKDSKIYQEISMNVVANVLGLGNAATPLRN